MKYFHLKGLQIRKSVLYLQPQLSRGLVVQLVRIHACHAWGRGFESRPDREIGESASYEAFFLPIDVFKTSKIVVLFSRRKPQV